MPTEKKPPSLKSASGAGFSFEDKVAATLMAEMLAARHSLGSDYGVAARIERQANDWEPFGDILVTAGNYCGEACDIGGSVKSNRQVTANGVTAEFAQGIWAALNKKVIPAGRGALSLYSAPLSPDVFDQLNSLCRQARELEPERLDQKIVHEKARKIYESFADGAVGDATKLPGVAFKNLIVRQFDFEAVNSNSEADVVQICRELLTKGSRTDDEAKRLWQDLLTLSVELRISGGAVTRERLIGKLRGKFQLQDDPADVAAWSKIRRFSTEGVDEVRVALPGGLSLPRVQEYEGLRAALQQSRACLVLGDSGLGKSALVKKFAAEREAAGDEVIWLRAERIPALYAAVPDFEEVARRTRRSSGLLIIDAIEACYDTSLLSRVARAIMCLGSPDSAWCVIITCQTPEWARVSSSLTRELSGHAVLSERIECGPLSDDDFTLVRANSTSVNLLAATPALHRLLRSPKMLDVLLTGQLAENRDLAGEADLVEWWWENQVRGGKQIAAEETVARQLASTMADELCSELPPDCVTGVEEAANRLIQSRVLRRTPEGLLRFDHDLLADWSRVMHLKSLGGQTLMFLRTHTENPPWLRAIRLLSQHLLDRAADFQRWYRILEECSTPASNDKEPSAQDLQVVDAWLEGVAFSIDPKATLERVRDLLFAKNGWYLRRLIGRLIHVATIPDPVAQDRARQIDAEAAEAAAAVYRLPIWTLWAPLINFLVSNRTEVIEVVPVEIAELSQMWARLEEYLHIKWAPFADLVMLNAEIELRREVAGEYRHFSGPHGRGNKPRIAIYTGALHAASQCPDRAAKLILKASGRADWDAGDVNARADEEWTGNYTERRRSIGIDTVEMPVISWADGPVRRTSRDFFHAWFESGAALALYKQAPAPSCEATLAFLLAWPKRRLFASSFGSHGRDNHGFNFEADHMYPPFYHKGPFLSFLRHDWRPALDMIIRLVDFATERYAEWWPYEDKPTELNFQNPVGETVWFGNHQVYIWNRFNSNTPHAITVALMALEKWFDEQIEAEKSIDEPIQIVYEKARSLAFGGLLVGLGKRHPELFLNKLQPLLFVRELYMYDFSAARETIGIGYWPRDGQFINNLRREWEQLPGRKTSLLDAVCGWFIEGGDLQPILEQVGAAWTAKASSLPEENRLVLLRWAANFEKSNWQKTIRRGQEFWERVLPQELRDEKAEQAHVQRQSLLAMPYQCSDLLEKRPELEPSSFEGIWRQLQNWPVNVTASSSQPNNEIASSLLDDRHSRAGLLAVLLCLGGDWLDEDQSRREWVESELRKLISNPPRITAYTAEDIHDDAEGFLARSTVRCWAKHPDDEGWRTAIGSFVAVYRYRSLAHLFDEAFKVRSLLGGKYRELEALALAFAVVRRKAKLDDFNPASELIEKWMGEWVPTFARGHGPMWTDQWADIEFQEPFPPAHDPYGGMTHGRGQRSRRWYGFDMGVVLAAFGGLPSLSEAKDAEERCHWLATCRELIGVYIRTLPIEDGDDDPAEEWRFEPWEPDQKIADILAARIFDCSPDEQRELWLPFFELPPAAHYHITQLLSSLLIEALRGNTLRITTLLPLWRAMAEHLFTSKGWKGDLRFKEGEVWKYLFFYGTPFDSVRDKDHRPLVEGMRDLFERHLREMDADDHDQSALAAFLTSDAGQCLLPDALEWLSGSWERATSYFWDDVATAGAFERLLKLSWRYHFQTIRGRPELLQAFKLLTLNLASQQLATAIDIQRQIGNS
jgi:hypothetical protein